MLYPGYVLLIFVAAVFAAFVLCCLFGEAIDDRAADQPAETAEQRVARAWAEWQALAARSEALLAAAGLASPPPPPGKVAAPPMLLPCFPYAARGDDNEPSSETTVECAICLDSLQPGQLCSEVPSCRHVFHGDCLGQWARSTGSCPLCRAKIVPESDEVATADDMV